MLFKPKTVHLGLGGISNLVPSFSAIFDTLFSVVGQFWEVSLGVDFGVNLAPILAHFYTSKKG